MDACDLAEETIERAREAALKRRRFLTPETPRRDGRGRLICRDCARHIPHQRQVAQPNAVRCLVCESAREEKNKV